MTIKILKVTLAFLFLLCLLDWSYGYYQLVRFVGMVGFIILAYKEYKNNRQWVWVWVASAILINPLVKIALGRTIWNIMDIVWAVLLIISIFKKGNEVDDSNKKI